MYRICKLLKMSVLNVLATIISIVPKEISHFFTVITQIRNKFDVLVIFTFKFKFIS